MFNLKKRKTFEENINYYELNLKKQKFDKKRKNNENIDYVKTKKMIKNDSEIGNLFYKQYNRDMLTYL